MKSATASRPGKADVRVVATSAPAMPGGDSRTQEEILDRQAVRDLADQKFALDQHSIVATTDVHGTITYVNDKFCEISKYSREELVGQNHRIVNSGHHPTAFFTQMYRTISNGNVWHGEICNRAKDGSLYWVEATIVPFLHPNGKPRQYLAIRTDITERKRAEEALKDSLAGKEALLKELADQKFALDQHAIVATTDVQGTITYVNDKFCAISKYSREELVGKNHRILNSGHHPKEFFQEMYRTIANGKVWRNEICNRAKDGSIYWVDTTIVPFAGNHGKPYQYIAIRADITERRAAEQQLEKQAEELTQQARELARSNADLEQFAYVASHDLQEPLRMVTAYTELLAERYKGKLDENADKFIGYAQDGATRMQVLIQDLLAFSRVGRKEDAIGTVDCAAVMQEVKQLLSSAIEESGAVVICRELPKVDAVHTQMVQLFQNLIGNAIKFRGKEAPRILVEAARKNGQWLFAVKDNGIGIAPEYAESIFVIFQRLHARAEYPGNGIGLAICKKIVERYGGKIWVESQPGAGSTFLFTVPVRASQKAEAAHA